MISQSNYDGQLEWDRADLSQRERALTSGIAAWATSTSYKVDDVLHFIQSEELRLPNGTVLDLRGRNQDFHKDFFRAIGYFEAKDKALVIRTFAHRLSELIESIARGESLIDNQNFPNAWQKLFGFIDKLRADDGILNQQNGYCNISKAVVGLQESFDKAGTMPFEDSFEQATFSELLGALQSDDRFKARWVTIIDSGRLWRHGSPDPTLQTHYIGAWQAYCLMPNAASLDELRYVARRLCEITTKEFDEEEILNRRGVSFVCTPSNSMADMIPQVFAELSDEYPWLPERPEVRREVEGKLRLLSESDGQKIADMCRLINETSGPLSSYRRPADWNACLALARRIVSEYENKARLNPPEHTLPFDDLSLQILAHDESPQVAEISKTIYEICQPENTPKSHWEKLPEYAKMVIWPPSVLESAAQAEIP